MARLIFGRVLRTFPKDGYGFIEADDPSVQSDVFFHEDDERRVFTGAFGHPEFSLVPMTSPLDMPERFTRVVFTLVDFHGKLRAYRWAVVPEWAGQDEMLIRIAVGTPAEISRRFPPEFDIEDELLDPESPDERFVFLRRSLNGEVREISDSRPRRAVRKVVAPVTPAPRTATHSNGTGHNEVHHLRVLEGQDVLGELFADHRAGARSPGSLAPMQRRARYRE